MDCKNQDQERRGATSLSSAVSEAVVEARSPDGVSEIAIELKSAEPEFCTSKDKVSEEIGENSSSPSVVSETAIEVKSSEAECCRGRDGVLQEIGDQSSETAARETVIEIRSIENGCSVIDDGNSKARINLQKASEVEKLKVSVAGVEKEAPVVVDVNCSEGRLVSGSCDGEKVCRICHLSSDRRSDGWELIQLGCRCKGELGMSHRRCAEAWFKTKGNRFCEICGEVAKNVTGVEDDRFLENWNERRTSSIGGSRATERGCSCWRGQPFCNFLMACLVIAFILPWFFRMNMF